tara:strand:+ start:6748 stop:8955 length:2208 start_codon:yes stop_codon:yes gene_type:complete
MYKIIIRIILVLIIFIFFSVIYLSNFGIKTNRFNSLIQSKINEIDSRINTEIEEVSLKLDLGNQEIKTNANNVNIYFNNNLIELSEINLNIDIFSFLKENPIIKKLEIYTKENKLKNILKIIQSYKFNFSTVMLENRVESGIIKSRVEIFFDEKSGNFLNFKISGSIKNGKINLLNNENIKKINLNYKIFDQNFLFNDLELEYNGIFLNSDKISIIQKNKNYFVEGDFKNKNKKISTKILKNILNLDFLNIEEQEIKIETNNKFNFFINQKMKINEINFNSNIVLDKISLLYKFDKVKDYIPNFNNLIIFKEASLKLDYSNKNLSVKTLSKYSFDKDFDDLKFNINKNNGNYKFDTEIKIKNSPLLLKFANYKKNEKKLSLLKIKGSYTNNDKIYFDQINYTENKNLFKISKLKLNNNFKISDISNLKINYVNQSLKTNSLKLKKIKDNVYILSGDFIDASYLFEDLFKEKKNKRLFGHFENLNLKLRTNLNKVFIDDNELLKDLSGSIVFKKNKIESVEINSNFQNNEKFLFSIKSTDKNEKVTTLYSDRAIPFVKHFKFIKGFSDGKIDYYSISKNNTSNSQIKIYDFKVKEVPALATLLSLASLQGIADIMTGEGLRFDEFEMNYKNKDNLMTINEIYSIGPAISILMEGYIEKNRLISLRGTLVPATTINKAVGTIPILGNILVGKKTGEGVFGVSFKIKGPPKSLKTTVNPVKTLTPRFITRTLRKIKKN